MATKTQIAADAVVLVDDVVEVAQAEAVEVITVVKNNPILLASVAVVGIAAGGFAGYKFAEKRLTPKFEARLQEELEASKKFIKAEEFATVESAAEELLEETIDELNEQYEADALEDAIVKSVRNYNRSPVRPEQIRYTEAVIAETKVLEQNVFVNGSPLIGEDWDDDEEVDRSGRSETEPYLISFNEYHSAVPGTTQLALTYYMVDDTLADENDQPVDNVEATIGIDNLEFIKTSPKLTSFVRNPRTEMEFEVARYDRGYQETVMGFEPGEDG